MEDEYEKIKREIEISRRAEEKIYMEQNGQNSHSKTVKICTTNYSKNAQCILQN